MGTQELISQLEAKKQDIRNKADQDIAQLDATIQTLKYLNSSYAPTTMSPVNGNGAIQLPDKYKGFNPSWYLRDKILFVLKSESKFLHIRQIAEILHSLEPKTSVEEFVTKIYTPIGQLKKDGIIHKYSIGNANINSFWGSVNWITQNGQIKEGFQYDEDQVKVQGTKTLIEL